MVPGEAFASSRAGGRVPVFKSFELVEGNRRCLLESAPYRLIKNHLDAAAGQTAVSPPAPSVLVAGHSGSATAALPQGVVIDYVLVDGQVPYLINVDFGNGDSTGEYGWAAIGKTDSDFWNFYTRDDGEGNYLEYGELNGLLLSDGDSTPVNLTVANAPGAWGNGMPDPMYSGYLYPYDWGNITVTLTNLPAGQYDFYLYGRGASDDGNAVFNVNVGGTDKGTKSTADGPGWTNQTWIENEQFVLFTNVTVGATDLVTVTALPGESGYALIAGMQIASTVGLDAPALTLNFAEDGGQCLLNMEHASATDFYSPVNTGVWPNPGAVSVANTYADSIVARAAGWNSSVSEGVNITMLPALTISPPGGYFNDPTTVTITVGQEDLAQMVDGIYRTELHRIGEEGGRAYWTSVAESLRDYSDYSDEQIRAALIPGFRGSWEYSIKYPVPADEYVENDTLTIQYSTNGGLDWIEYTGAFDLAGNVTLLARANKQTTADNRTHYAYLSSQATATFTYIPAAWLEQYFGANWMSDTNALPGADADGDGWSNLEEYMLGHDPRVPGSDVPLAVAIHDSSRSRINDTNPNANGRWLPSDPATLVPLFRYFVMPESVKEALRSDGTPFVVLDDADLLTKLLMPNGAPRYPILVSLAAESLSASEANALRAYVAAGGFLLMGSSSFTRFETGVTRGDFALANEMGMHCQPATWAANGFDNYHLTKEIEHRLVSHIPVGQITWRLPTSAEETSWGYTCQDGQIFNGPHRAWKVFPNQAWPPYPTTLATGDAGQPLLAITRHLNGYFIYDAALQPLIGHGGFAPGMYAYVILRRAIEWAFESAQRPIVKVSPWPYAYDAAFTVRHDLENFQLEIAQIKESAIYERGLQNVKGDYYFCTDAAKPILTPSLVSSWADAISYGATIAQHNGGAANPSCLGFDPSTYFYYHWGPDQVLDVPGGGEDYARGSLLAAFQQCALWGLNTEPRAWVAPFFTATRDRSYRMQEDLQVKITGDQKLTPFPHWGFSTEDPNLRFHFLQEPVSDWFVNGAVAQSLESWHDP
jgi:hypothetical protein